MSKTVCWQDNCPQDLPICCFECDRQEFCPDICDLHECYEGGEGEE